MSKGLIVRALGGFNINYLIRGHGLMASGVGGGAGTSTTIEDVRVESNSIASNYVRWVYSGSGDVEVFRSEDGVTYSSIGSTDGDDQEFIDEDVLTGVKYWYKLTDDSEATFSDVNTVIVQTCANYDGSQSAFNLPRFDGQEQQSDDLNNMAQRVEEMVNSKVMIPEPCLVCIDDGAVKFDCTDGCVNFRVVMTEDVNSITITNCGQCPQVEFIVPPEVIRKVCGWPVGCHHFGDECFQGPVDGEEFGKTLFTGGYTLDGYGNPPDLPPPGSCPCPPTLAMAIKCCSPNCNLNCTNNRHIKLKVCNGLAPYSWSKTGDITLSSTSGTMITVSSLASGVNNYPGQIAFVDIYAKIIADADTDNYVNMFTTNWTCYECDGAVIGGGPQECYPDFGITGQANYCFDPSDGSGDRCSTVYTNYGGAGNEVYVEIDWPARGIADRRTPYFTVPRPFNEDDTEDKLLEAMADMRSSAMIAGGCSSCTPPSGATVTCIDSVGVSVTYVL